MALRTLPKFPCVISLSVVAGRDVSFAELCVTLRVVRCAALGYFSPARGHWPCSYTVLLSLILEDALCRPPEPSLCAAASFLAHVLWVLAALAFLKPSPRSLTWHDCQAALVPPACAAALKPPLGSKRGQFQSSVHLLFSQGTQSCAIYCLLFENCYFMCFVWFLRKSLIVAGEQFYESKGKQNSPI